MEKGPQIRTIGNASFEEKEKANDKIKLRLFEHFASLDEGAKEKLKKFEYPKSPTELALIDFANKETNELMKEVGVEPYDVPSENYHILPPEFYNKVAGGGSATTVTSEQGILFDAERFRDNPSCFGSVAIHETLHLKAHLSLEVAEGDKDADVANYRRGTKIGSLLATSESGNYHEHFKGLDEAIVATQQKKSLAKLFEAPVLLKEKEWMSSDEVKVFKNELTLKKNIPEEDIIWVDEHNYEIINYPKQREVLDYVCSEIQKQFPKQYQSSDEVFKEFLKSHFTGQLLPIARLVEKTFGEGSFRTLGNMDTDKSSGALHLETLKKSRMRQLRDEK